MPFLVLELLEGEPLAAQVQRGPLAEERAWAIAAEVTRAVVYAHSQGVLHLDLKSQNVFVLGDDRVKVLDFGLAGLVAEISGNNDMWRTDALDEVDVATGKVTTVWRPPEALRVQDAVWIPGTRDFLVVQVDARSDAWLLEAPL